MKIISSTFPNLQILNSPKLIDFADNNFRFDENVGKFSNRLENSGKRRKCLFQAISSFHSVVKRLENRGKRRKCLFQTISSNF